MPLIFNFGLYQFDFKGTTILNFRENFVCLKLLINFIFGGLNSANYFNYFAAYYFNFFVNNYFENLFENYFMTIQMESRQHHFLKIH